MRPATISSTCSAGAGASRTIVAVRDLEHLRHAELAGEAGVRGKVHGLAVDRNGDRRFQPRIELPQLVAARMTRDVHEAVAVGDDANAASWSGR